MSKHCAFGCGKPLNMDVVTMIRWEYIGWVKKRPKGQGGIHSIELPIATGAVAHATCVDAAKRGIHPNQMSLAE